MNYQAILISLIAICSSQAIVAQDADTTSVSNQVQKLVAESDTIAYFDPVGGALTGLEHLQVGLHADNIAG